jgi:hypothetical protein
MTHPIPDRFRVGDNMMNAWLRINPPHEANP